jgi:CHAT domain-containing protein/tetratricopeptide (TPR) repeat protein
MRSPERLPGIVIWIMLLICLLRFERLPGGSSVAQTNEVDAIRPLVERLFKSYQQKELDKLISLWSEKSPFLAENKRILQDELAGNEKIVVHGFDIRQIKIDGDKAILRVVADLTLTSGWQEKATEKRLKKNRTIQLMKEGGVWKAWKFIPREEELAAEIISARTEAERNTLLKREPELITSDLADALIRQNYYTSNFQDAYQETLAIGQAVYRLLKAGKKQEEITPELTDPLIQQVYPPSTNRGDYRLSLAVNQLAANLAEQLGDRSVMASVMANAGYIHGWIGTPERSPELALDYFQKSLKIAEEFGLRAIMARSLIDAAMVHESQSELSRAAEYYQRGLKLAEELGLHEMTGKALNNLGIIHRLTGNYAKAIELWLKSQKLAESRLESGADWRRLSMALLNIADAFAVQGNYQQALAYHKKGVDAAEKAIELGYPFIALFQTAVLALIGANYDLRTYNYSLLDSVQKGLKMAEPENTPLSLNDPHASPVIEQMSIFKTELGEGLVRQNDMNGAIASYQEALMWAEKGRDRPNISRPLWGLAKASLLKGEYREALGFVKRAIEAEEQTNQAYLCEVLVTAAQIHMKLGQPEEARQALLRAIDIIEKTRGQLTGGELDRAVSFENAVAPYQQMIDLLVDQKRYTEAFSYAQRAKGRTLLELLQNGRIDIAKSASPAEREEERLLTRKIASLNRELTSEKLKSQPDEKRLRTLGAQLIKVRSEFDVFQTNLYLAHPELKVQRGEIRPVSFDDVSSLIPDTKTALLDFIVADENVHLFVLTKDASAQPALNTYTFKIDRKSLAEKVERFRGRMENRDYDFQELSQELYVLLIKPAEKQLPNKTSLIISPDNVLWNLPFQTLLSPGLRYLIEDAAISYAPSLSVLREMRLASKNERTPARASILALGNPALGNRSKELVKFIKMDAELQPLPEAAAQVRALGRLYGPTLSQIYTGSAAREELVKERSARYRILHLATHGILNNFSPMYSHVMLSQTPGKGGDDGLLEAWEMMNLDLNADLVVLAACETARGRVGTGEGIIGMSWALFVAGCPRTVVSQWKVEASSTTALMVEFHKRFKTRYGGTRQAVSTAEAMRQAALKVMNNPEYVHPFYWGGFVVVGDGN